MDVMDVKRAEYQPNPFICIPLFHSDVTVLLSLQFQKMDISIFVPFFLFHSSGHIYDFSSDSDVNMDKAIISLFE